MIFNIQPNDALPIYCQLMRQVKHAVAAGVLKPGDQLPSLRELSKDLVINHLTVKKAYETLEREGVIRTARGTGTFVADHPSITLKAEGEGALRERIRGVVDEARLMQLTKKQLLAEVEQAWN